MKLFFSELCGKWAQPLLRLLKTEDTFVSVHPAHPRAQALALVNTSSLGSQSTGRLP